MKHNDSAQKSNEAHYGEICHALMHPDWIGHVKIESPDKLIDAYAKQLELAKSAIAE